MEDGRYKALSLHYCKKKMEEVNYRNLSGNGKIIIDTVVYDFGEQVLWEDSKGYQET